MESLISQYLVPGRESNKRLKALQHNNITFIKIRVTTKVTAKQAMLLSEKVSISSI
jgi:hypothetical protein